MPPPWTSVFCKLLLNGDSHDTKINFHYDRQIKGRTREGSKESYTSNGILCTGQRLMSLVDQLADSGPISQELGHSKTLKFKSSGDAELQV